MNPFVYSIPTDIYFGAGQIERLGEVVKAHGSKALLVYGGGSIRKNGVYDATVKELRSHGVDFVELGGVDPNPRVSSVRQGVALCREHGIDVILPVGGGSTIDCAKVIAASVKSELDPWEIVRHPERIGEVLPVVSVLTLSATGSEMDIFAVISNPETNDKLGVGHPKMRPVASILDPTYTCTVNAWQTASGTADIMSHLFEVYFSNTAGFMQDRMTEALLKTCVEFGPIAVKEPGNVEARANLMWTSSWAINGLMTLGKEVAWTVHPMEHELSAFYDITHGAGLAILTPHWMRAVLNEKTAPKFRELGVNVWGVDPKLETMEIARLAIDRTAAFFRQMGLPATLGEVGIDESKLAVMAAKVAPMIKGAYVELSEAEILAIYKAAL